MDCQQEVVGLPRPLFERILGPSFHTLPPALRRIHDCRASKTLSGRCSIQRGSHWLVPLIAPLASLPNSVIDSPIRVTIDAREDAEQWYRDFSGHAMNSRLWFDSAGLCERLGVIEFLFALRANGGRIEWSVTRLHMLGIPLSTRILAARACESVKDGRYEFDVSAALLGVGLLIHYWGWLEEI